MIYGKTVMRVDGLKQGTSVIGEVSKSTLGNIILRVGHTNNDRSWTQTEYVVLTQDERDALIIEMLGGSNV